MVDAICRKGKSGGDFSSGFNAPELYQSHAYFGDGVRDELGSIALSFRPDDGGPPLLLCLGHDELGSLRLLLCHLLLLNVFRELFPIGEMCDGHIIKDYVEVFGPLDEAISHQCRHVGPLHQKLVRIELHHHYLKDLVANGG